MKRYRAEVGACGGAAHRIDYVEHTDGEFVRYEDCTRAFCRNCGCNCEGPQKIGPGFHGPHCSRWPAVQSHEQLIEFLEGWCHDGNLQTFESRERFRREAGAVIAKLRATDEKPNG